MERFCPACGASVAEAAAFCGKCGAPQPSAEAIQSAQPPVALPPPPPATFPSAVAAPPPAPITPLAAPPSRIDWSKAWPGVVIAGGAAGLLSAAPVVSIGCCLWVLAAGAMSVLLYRNRAAVSVHTGMGARLGAATGAVAAMISSIFTTIGMLVMGSGKMREAFRQGMEQSAQNNPDPKAQEMVRNMADFLSTPGGFATAMTLWFALLFLVLMAFAAGGGALGASLFGKRDKT